MTKRTKIPPSIRSKNTAENALKNSAEKKTGRETFPENDKLPIFLFRNVDADGKFAFNPNRQDFAAEDFLSKLLAYSKMTWQEISGATHDQAQSKHHYISTENLSKDAWERINAKNLTDEIDAIFSFALSNIIRVIGIREGNKFHVVWYDAKHEFSISQKKHT